MSSETVENFEDMLPLYYKRIFPAAAFIKWLSYGDMNYLRRREFSFTLPEDIYVRYQTVDTLEGYVQQIATQKPIKIDIGAVYSRVPSMDRTVHDPLVPQEKEVVFDIDMTDYDEIRTCCSGADVCNKCWKFMKIAMKIIDAAMREDFGLNNLLWIFSGRRGIHCWVCDKQARMFQDHARQTIAEFLFLFKGSKITLWGSKIHYSIQRALDIIKQYFMDIVREQDILGTDERFRYFLSLIDVDAREKYEKAMEKENTSEARWNAFTELHRSLMQQGMAKKHTNLVEEMMLQFGYPRLDIHVTRTLNHLLKAPFCVHPKTGKICVPFNPKLIDKFDLDTVPTLSLLVNEITKHDNQTIEQEKQDAMEIGDGNIMATLSTMADYRKTSLLKPVRIFEEFIRGLNLDAPTTAELM